MPSLTPVLLAWCALGCSVIAVTRREPWVRLAAHLATAAFVVLAFVALRRTR